MLCFPLFFSPVRIVGVLILISLRFVAALSFFGRFWYSYILFLIYVGGLLVLLIYICLVRRNFPVKTRVERAVLVIGISMVCRLSKRWPQPLKFLGGGRRGSGTRLVEGRNVSIFLFLVILLLGILLVVVRVSGVGSAIVVNEKS